MNLNQVEILNLTKTLVTTCTIIDSFNDLRLFSGHYDVTTVNELIEELKKTTKQLERVLNEPHA